MIWPWRLDPLILEPAHVSFQCGLSTSDNLDVCWEVARCRSNVSETSPPAGLSTKCTCSCLDHDVSFVRASGASSTRVAVRRGSEEMHSAIRTIREDIVVFDIFAHAVWMVLEMQWQSKCFSDPDSASQQAANGGRCSDPTEW